MHKDGYAILNADDDLTYKMAEGLDCKVAFFSMDEENPRIHQHIAQGGLAAVYENGFISIYKNTYKIRIDRAADIPLTFGGRAIFNIQNVLAAVLAGYVNKFDTDDIKMALRTFIPSSSKTPGRMNLFQFPTFEVLVDYAHNVAGLQAVGEFLRRTDAVRKVGVIAGIGDRRDEDTVELGKMAAELFDEIVIRQDRDLRGKSGDYINQLLKEGIASVDPNKKVIEINNEMKAIAFCLKTPNVVPSFPFLPTM